MSRTMLCLTTAAVLAFVSIAWMVARQQVLGSQVNVPNGADTWKITFSVLGKSTGDAKLITAMPLDFGRQHVLRESYRSEALLEKPPAVRHPERRQVLWTQRAGTSNGPFRARAEFYVMMNVARPSASMTELARQLYAPPGRGECLQSEALIEGDEASVTEVARRLTHGLNGASDQAEALFRFVADEIENEPHVSGVSAGAAECLKNATGDAAAKSRLLVALLRNREIPARLVTGLTLSRGPEQ